ncbi:hypothetical protein [Pseudoflavonifractor phocaeensis]|uniref:hypothetical protein n=1 Tax=Pseudoflavonifractor phocaeensis TaxID=1870988 RepID=UPI00195C8F8E|nr:hypothetical protein [Pseudoflavonifractor phocaeensis]MBM6927426.1 hypothetical protein [Pseudoflavonifractor phocaeensis]
MATYTANYGLHQWVPEDNFQRTDFNTDLSKIDAGLKTAQDTADGAASAASAAQSAADAAQDTADEKSFVTSGRYTGNGSDSRTISLGFQPRAVLVECRNGNRLGTFCGGLAVTGSPCYLTDIYGGLTLTTTGFTVRSNSGSCTNDSNTTYHYLALRA